MLETISKAMKAQSQDLWDTFLPETRPTSAHYSTGFFQLIRNYFTTKKTVRAEEDHAGGKCIKYQQFE